MMQKIIPPRSWDFDGAQLETVKFVASGLRGNDLAAFIKRASHPLAYWARNNPPEPGEVYTHSINLGSTEKAGANRNADGYSDRMLSEDHPTFEQAHFFLNHQNRDPHKSYGRVKKAFYNRDIGRVDTITALYATKEAADRNQALVAERTLNKMASGLDVAVSQSCTVPTDVCMSCGNRAKNRTEYCGPEHCKYGGCRDNLGRVFDDGFHLFVDNPKCKFFDLSDVSDSRGADRTAFITGKIASPDRVIGGAELAESLGLVAPDYLLDPQTLRAVSCLRKLAAFRYPDFAGAPAWEDCVACRKRHAKAAADVPYPVSDYDRHALVAELGSAGVVLPPARWLSYMTGVDAEKCAAVFTRPLDVNTDLLGRSDAHDTIAAAVAPSDNQLSRVKWAWLSPSPRTHSAETAIAVYTPQRAWTKMANASPATEAVVRAGYVAYQGRVLAANDASPNFDTLLAECTRHNRLGTL